MTGEKRYSVKFCAVFFNIFTLLRHWVPWKMHRIIISLNICIQILSILPGVSLALRQCVVLSGKWQECHCERHRINAGRVVCQNLNWAPTIPFVPNATDVQFRMTSLTIARSKIILLKKDTFLGQDITALDLSYNQINFVNSQAFRGLEVEISLLKYFIFIFQIWLVIGNTVWLFKNKLIQLTLNHNLLTAIPVTPLAELAQLQYLWLKYNRINHLDSHTFRVRSQFFSRFHHFQ